MTRDLTRFFGICDVEKAILTFPPHSILSLPSKKKLGRSRHYVPRIFINTQTIWGGVDITIQEFSLPILERPDQDKSKIKQSFLSPYGNTV